MTHKLSRTTTITALAAAAALALVAVLALSAAPAGAIVPPKDCGRITVKNKRYNVKADQLRCRTARRYTSRYLRNRTKPRGYKCYRYKGSSLVFKCVKTRANPDKTFFAIKRS